MEKLPFSHPCPYYKLFLYDLAGNQGYKDEMCNDLLRKSRKSLQNKINITVDLNRVAVSIIFETRNILFDDVNLYGIMMEAHPSLETSEAEASSEHV